MAGGTQALRMAFTQTLIALAKTDERIVAVATDSRGSVTLTEFGELYPDRLIECGIAEQNAVGVAAGLAMGGLIPFACGPACFLSLRAAEQIKVDAAYSRANVKVIGVSGGVSYGALGATHHAVQDIALMRALPGLEVYLPCDGRQMVKLTEYLAKSLKPAYVRVGRGAVPDVYTAGDAPFAPGRANLIHGGANARAAIIATGEMVYPALMAARALGDVQVYDMHTIKPLDTDAIKRAARTGNIITVEEHSVLCGLGGAVAEVVCQGLSARVRILGLPDENLYTGASAEVKAHYGLTEEGIAKAVREML